MRRHGLEPFLSSAAVSAGGTNGVEVLVQPNLGHINLRGSLHKTGIAEAAERELGQALPAIPNTMTLGNHRVFWLGPDEWLIMTGIDDAGGLAERLRASMSGSHTAVNDISGGQVALQLAGKHARDLLAMGCTLDFHPDVFRPGDCAQSGLAKANVLIGLLDDSPVFDLVVRRSFSDYLCRWFAHAGRDFGMAFTAH